jgi:hypothetical protein
MWKRIRAYIVGIPLIFIGLLHAYTWYVSRQMHLVARRGLAEIAAREAALASLGDIALDPATVTLADLERSLHQPNLSLPGGHNTTRIGWACAANDCEAWASFLQTPGTKLDASARAVVLSVRDHVMQRRLHQVSIGGVYFGEPVSEMLAYCNRRGYGETLAYHRIKWDKDWSVIWTEASGGRVFSLIFLNDNLIKRVEATRAGRTQS